MNPMNVSRNVKRSDTKLSRRSFLRRGAAAGAGVYSMSAGLSLAEGNPAAPQATPVAPGSKGTLPVGKIGKAKISRLISGGNVLSGWCHQRDLLFVRDLAAAYNTEQRQFDTLQMLEELGVNAIILDPNQQDILNKYKQVRGGEMQAIICVREEWYDWSTGNWDGLKTQILKAIEKGSDLLYLHGGYWDRLLQAKKPKNIEVIAKAMQFMREQGFSAGLGAHELQVLKTCESRGIRPDYYVKTFHQDRYWSATPRERRKPFSVDGPKSQDHNNDRLARNEICAFGTTRPESFCSGWITWTVASDNTNATLLTDPSVAKLASYISRAKNLYKCPADHYLASAQRRLGWKERVRSISMNGYMGESVTDKTYNMNMANGQRRTIYGKLGSIRNLSPAKAWVFVDEHPDSINDACFMVNFRVKEWADIPASYHNSSGSEGGRSASTRANRRGRDASCLASRSRIPAGPIGALKTELNQIV